MTSAGTPVGQHGRPENGAVEPRTIVAPLGGAARWSRALRARATAFARDRRGLAMVEFAGAAPFLLMIFMGGITLFQMFQFNERLSASTSTVADIASRTQNVITVNRLNEIHTLFQELSASPDVRMRVVSVRHVWTDQRRRRSEMKVDWVYDSDRPNSTTIPTDLPTDRYPIVTVNDSILVVETWGSSKPFFNFFDRLEGIQEYESSAIVRPRYLGHIRHETQNQAS